MDHVDSYNIKTNQYKDETVCYLGPIAGYWGHILTEISCCLWYAIQNPHLKWAYFDYTDHKVTLVRKPLLEFLQLLEISEAQLIPVTEPTQFAKVIIPEVSAVAGKYYTKEFKHTFDFIRNKVQGECITHNKLYLTKTEFESERDNQIGEEAIKNVFEKNGFLCVAPEKLSVKEQVLLMANATEIIAPEGTLPHNILFCKDHIKVTIINRKVGVNNYQLLINQLRNAQIVFIDCWYMLLPIYHGPYIFTINQNFERYANDNNIIVDTKETQYIKEYFKIFWYILKYLQSYDLKDDGAQLKKVWNSESIEGFLISRKHMDFICTEEAIKFSAFLQECIRRMVD